MDTKPRSQARTALAVTFILSVAGQAGCNLIDDEPSNTTGDGGSDDGNAVCLEIIESASMQCMPPQQFWAEYNGAEHDMVLIDDPAIVVNVLGGLLLNVGSGADYIGTYHHEGPSCGAYCGWCQPGQSMCLSGFDANGAPECMLCITPTGNAQQDQTFCEDHLAVCEAPGLDDTSGGGADETGGADDGGVAPYYDCAWWDPIGAVTWDSAGRAYVDQMIVDDVAQYVGVPLSQCDGTLFSLTSSGHFKVERLATGGVLHQLGLRAGDVILQSNGVELDDLEAIADVTVDLFYNDPASWFTLTYRRRTATTQLTIVVQ